MDNGNVDRYLFSIQVSNLDSVQLEDEHLKARGCKLYRECRKDVSIRTYNDNDTVSVALQFTTKYMYL